MTQYREALSIRSPTLVYAMLLHYCPYPCAWFGRRNEFGIRASRF